MSGTNSQVNKVSKALKSDPKKTGALAVLVLLALVMLGRTFMGGNKPRSASAKSAIPAKKVDKASVQAAAPRSNAVAAALQKWSDAPSHPVSRNLFAVKIEYFPVEGSRTLAVNSEDGFWTRLEKSLALQADQRDKRDNLIANFTAQAGKLKLQSTMINGPQPKALINGELVGEGSVVADFRVLKIEARRIIVEREGIRLEIQMK